MTILTVANRVAVQAGIPIFSTFVANTDRTATELRTHLHEAGEEITRRTEWSNLIRSTTVAATNSSVALPVDYHRLVMGNAIMCTATPFKPYTPVRSPDQWQLLSAVPSTEYYFFVNSGRIYFSPVVPTGGVTVRYISKNWITNGATSVAEALSDTDTVKFSETLLAIGVLYRYRQAKGLPYADLQGEFEAELAREILADRGL